MSNINPQNIDGTFPIAGQDNNSQGFRDNFTNTINNFTFAAAELTDLQTYAVLAAPLSSVGQTGTPTNNMNYAYLTKPQLKAAVETVVSPTVATGTFTVDWSQGHFQEVTITSNTSMSFASTWPTTNLWTRLRLQVVVSGGTYTLTLPSTVTVNIASIQGYVLNSSPAQLTLAAGTYVFEFSTYNNGSAVAIQDVFRDYKQTLIQQYKPTANVALTANVGVNTLLITPTGTLVSFGANVTLPNTTVDGTTIKITSNIAVSQLATQAPWLSSVSPFGNVTLTAGASAEFVYVTADNKWYKTR